MSWRENLRRATFRGIEFHVDGSETGFGRRSILHEFPDRDVPYAEDLGKKAREITFNAYVLGEDYLTQRDRLMKVIETNPQPGTLVHPTLGTMRVKPATCRVRFSNREGGIEYFTLTFFEAGENRYPDNSTDTVAQVNTSAATAASTLRQVFSDRFTVGSLPDYVSNNAVTVATQMADAIQAAVNQFAGESDSTASTTEAVTKFKADATTLVQSPATYAERTEAMADGILEIHDDKSLCYAVFESLLTFGDDFVPIAETTTTRAQQAKNRRAQVRLVHRVALIGMAKSAARIDFESQESASDLRDTLADRLDDALLALGDTDDDDSFRVLMDLRASAIRDITERAASLRRIKILSPRTTLPAVWYAYDIYESFEREAEIVARNRLRRPGFVPGGKPLEVLV